MDLLVVMTRTKVVGRLVAREMMRMARVSLGSAMHCRISVSVMSRSTLRMTHEKDGGFGECVWALGPDSWVNETLGSPKRFWSFLPMSKAMGILVSIRAVWL